MDWLLLAIISLIAASFLGVLRKILVVNSSKPLDIVILFQFFSSFFVLILLLINGFNMPNILDYPVNYLINAVLWGGSMILLFNAYKYIEASEIAVFATIELVLAIILGYVFLGENITLIMLLGLILVITSILILSIKKPDSFKFNKGLVFVTLAAIMAGAAVTNDVFILKNTDALGFIFIGFLFPGLFVYIIKVLKTKNFKFDLMNVNMKVLALLAFLAVIANIPFYFAFTHDGQISQVLTIHKTSIIFTILLSAVLLKERENLKRKIFSGILAVIGIILIGI